MNDYRDTEMPAKGLVRSVGELRAGCSLGSISNAGHTWGRIHFTREDGIATISIDRHVSGDDVEALERVIRDFLTQSEERQRVAKEQAYRQMMAQQQAAVSDAFAAQSING